MCPAEYFLMLKCSNSGLEWQRDELWKRTKNYQLQTSCGFNESAPTNLLHRKWIKSPKPVSQTRKKWPRKELGEGRQVSGKFVQPEHLRDPAATTVPATVATATSATTAATWLYLKLFHLYNLSLGKQSLSFNPCSSIFVRWQHDFVINRFKLSLETVPKNLAVQYLNLGQ